MRIGLVSIVFCAAAVVAAVPAVADDIDVKVQACSLCHGQNGEPTDVSVPTIWGQQSNYLFKELHDYHSGDLTNPMMSLVVKDIQLPDLRKIAAYFAEKTWPPRKTAAGTAAAPEGIDQCRACHQPNFEGGAPAPRLAGLSYEYLIGAMNGFADGTRTNNLDMPGFMKALTASQREAMAHYLAGL